MGDLDMDTESQRLELLTDMAELEKKFHDLKRQLLKERVAQVDASVDDIKNGTAKEYVIPLKRFEDEREMRHQVADVWRELETRNVANKFESEAKSIELTYDAEKLLLFETIRDQLQEQIKQLRSDMNNDDIFHYSDWQLSSSANRKTKTGCVSKKRQKRKSRRNSLANGKTRPRVVTGPYIVYQLSDSDILEDWSTIRKALTAASSKTRSLVIYQDSRLLCDGVWYTKGQRVYLRNRDNQPTRATILSVNESELVVRKADGQKSKISLHNLENGKFAIKLCQEFN